MASRTVRNGRRAFPNFAAGNDGCTFLPCDEDQASAILWNSKTLCVQNVKDIPVTMRHREGEEIAEKY